MTTLSTRGSYTLIRPVDSQSQNSSNTTVPFGTQSVGEPLNSAGISARLKPPGIVMRVILYS